VCHLSLQCESLQDFLLRCDLIVIFTEASVNKFVVLAFESELLQESFLPLWDHTHTSSDTFSVTVITATVTPVWH